MEKVERVSDGEQGENGEYGGLEVDGEGPSRSQHWTVNVRHVVSTGRRLGEHRGMQGRCKSSCGGGWWRRKWKR